MWTYPFFNYMLLDFGNRRVNNMLMYKLGLPLHTPSQFPSHLNHRCPLLRQLEIQPRVSHDQCLEWLTTSQNSRPVESCQLSSLLHSVHALPRCKVLLNTEHFGKPFMLIIIWGNLLAWWKKISQAVICKWNNWSFENIHIRIKECLRQIVSLVEIKLLKAFISKVK